MSRMDPKYFLKIHVIMLRFSKRFFVLLSFPVSLKFETLLVLSFLSCLFRFSLKIIINLLVI